MLWICFALFCLAVAAEGQLRAWHCPRLLSLIVETAWWRQLSSALHTNDINRHTVHTPKDSDRRTFHSRKEMIEKESWTIEKERKTTKRAKIWADTIFSSGVFSIILDC